MICTGCSKRDATVFFKIISKFAWCQKCFDDWQNRRTGVEVQFITFEEYVISEVMQS